MKIFLTIIAFILFAGHVHAAEVKNEVVKQSGNRMLFEFDVTGDSGEEADVIVTLTINGVTYTADKIHLEGDFGKVKTGKGKKIYWNALQDFPRGLSTTFDWEIVAGAGPVEGMVLVKGGCYQMGDTFGDGEADEKPVHEVCVDDFYMGKYEVTVGEFRQFVNDTGYKTEAEKGDGCYTWTGSEWKKDSNKNWKSPGFSQDNRQPVVCVSWNDSTAFTEWVSKKTGKKYRLPTEAEWEYAAKSGGKKEKWSGTNSESALGEYAWYTNNSGGTTHPVGQKKPNGLGLYDMSGNVWEWVQDWYDSNYYQNSLKDNPKGPGNGQLRALRGGSWYGSPRNGRSASRSRSSPGGNGSNGFRLLRTH